MKERIRKKLEKKSRMDSIMGCSSNETGIREAPWKPAFIGESAVRARYEELQQTNRNHPLLNQGEVVGRNFRFTDVFYNQYGIPSAQHLKSSHVLHYLVLLGKAIKGGTQ